jgi:hypothetical protein
MTLLLPDENVAGLQVRRKGSWLTVKPIPNAFIINIGDQIQVYVSLSITLLYLEDYFHSTFTVILSWVLMANYSSN